MAEKSFDYKSWSLEELRAEARKRFILFTRKDGVETLASKLRMHDRLMSEKEPNTEEKLEFAETVDEEEASDLTFDQRLQLLQLERQIRIEEREAEREKREYERQVERERREYERQKAREEEERSIREEERLKTLRNEKEEFAIREAGRQQSCVRKPKFIKIREMREGEDIDDYFRIFEMTAKAQGLPEDEWVGNLVPKLTEKAKSIYLEIPDPAAQNYEESKSIIIKGYQLTADHYRYRFRTSEKKPDEDFVQWGYRTRRYLNRWMTVAEATGDVEKILEQFMIERLLDAVSRELRAWLKEQKPKTAEELGNLANLHVQSRKGPLVEGRYASFGKNKGVSIQKQPQIKREPPIKEQASGEQTKPVITPSRRNIKLPVTCYKCGKQGHMSFNCVKGNNKPAQGYLLCMTPLKSHELEFPPCNVQGKIEGKSAEMIIDSGCTRTLVHEKFVKNGSLTGEEMSVLTATGERLIVPLAKVEIESGQGKHVELVGVLDKLPVDCLLGRSSFGQTLSKENVLKQWERNVSDYDCKINEAFVLTRGQKALVDAQRRADALIDRENSLAVETLSKKEPRQHGLKQGDLPTLFGDSKPEETSDESLICNTEIAPTENEPPINILDRNKTQLAADQNADVTLDRVRRGVSEKAPEESDGYFSQDGILMHRRFIKAEHNGTRYVDRIVVPESYRNEILRVAHTIPLSGHMGFAKTLDRIGAHFFWPGLSSDVRKFCATCPQCQLVARKLKSHRAPLRPVEVVTEPFKKIAIDIVGELPRSTSGYKYILTIVDYATRYPEAVPLRTTNSKAIADALIQYFSKVGIPDEIVSDEGSNFMSKLMAQLYEQLGINKIKTSIYHPQANGLVERFNGTLKAIIKKFVGEHVQAWDRYLPYLLFAYREVPCESTGYSPFELLYGRTVRGPLAIVKESWIEKKPTEGTIVSHVLEIRRRLATMQKVVKQNLKQAQSKQKRVYDSHSSHRRLEVGDKALVLLPSPGNKLEMRWQGPYAVTKVFKDGLNYELDTGKIPQKLEEEVNKEIEKMLQLGIIRPSMSPWASPVVIVPKPDGTIRFCVDYRKVNKVTKMDAYPIPSMERMIEKVASAKYISTIDLTKGYWQIPLETSTIEKSAFITTKGLYEFLVMPFGMKTAPATFQRMMSEIVLRGLEFADAYIDDVEVDTPTSFPQHISELRQVFQRLRTCKLNARPSKCKIAMSSVDFVGHRVGGNRIEPRTALVQTIKEYPRPETKKQIRSFLGLVGYYRRFIPNFSSRTAVLTDLTRGKSPTKIKWKDAHEFAFQDLKQALQNPPVLRPPHWEQEFILQVDASNRGLGAILSQQDKEGLEHPIAYASRKLQPREEKLSTTEKECLGIVWAVELFRYYLFGRQFRLQTDHNPLVWLNQVRDKNRKLLRWSITLQEYDIDVEHKSGKNNSNVDALSRA
ncbi:uncharacterized protein [Montipora foliosa]|uniref:uncharacterized protein n=1 Tax=Montipora foliosa TaxID=591990 RepID=UPI0035F1D44E